MNWNQLPKWAIPAATGALSFGAGAAVGYFVRKHLDKKAEEQIEEVQLEFNFATTEMHRETNRIEYATRQLKEQGDALISHIRDLAIIKDIPVEASRMKHPSTLPPLEKEDEEEPEAEVVHIFASSNEDPEWDYEVECAKRDPERPYVIHRDEFFADEMGIQEQQSSTTLTYYKGDQVLVDSHDRPIYDFESIVGPMRFGHGSGDPSIFYVRNESEEVEYEIVEDDGYYQEVVLGEEVEHELEERDLKHFRQPRKFRED